MLNAKQNDVKNYPANSGSDEPSQGIEVCAGDRGMDGVLG